MPISNCLPSWRRYCRKTSHPLRGTFAKSDLNFKVHTIDTKAGENHALLMADSTTGEYLRGTDATTGLPPENYGNYGVVYNVDYKLKGDKPYELWLNPWGGMYAGVGVLEQGGERKLIDIPDIPAFGKLGEEGFRIARLEPGSEGRFTWSPPALPICRSGCFGCPPIIRRLICTTKTK